MALAISSLALQLVIHYSEAAVSLHNVLEDSLREERLSATSNITGRLQQIGDNQSKYMHNM